MHGVLARRLALARRYRAHKMGLSCLLFLWMGLASSGALAESLDIDRELRAPGVRLLAVEFFATWCQPCMDAVPRWKALHERYRNQGLRFVVVVTRDPEGACADPGWMPDAVICDDQGFLTDRFGVKALPAAYLWNWQGDLLGNQVHVDEVELQIQEWMGKSPRIDVGAGRMRPRSNIDMPDLVALVRSQMVGQGKFRVVAANRERLKLRSLVEASLKNSADEDLACHPGRELSANSWLKVSIVGRSTQRLLLELFSVEAGCLYASGSAVWLPKRATMSVNQALSRLARYLERPRVQLPFVAAGGRPLPEGSSGTRQVAEMLRGRPLPEGPPETLQAAEMQLSAAGPGASSSISRDSLAQLEVRSTFKGVSKPAALFIDSRPAGTTPFQGTLAPGVVEIEAKSGRMRAKQTVALQSGVTRRVDIALEPPRRPLTRWLLFGGSAASLIGGGILLGVAEAQIANANAAQNRSEVSVQRANDVERLQIIGTGALVTSGALLGTGLILEWIGRSPSSGLSLVPSPHGLGVAASGQF